MVTIYSDMVITGNDIPIFGRILQDFSLFIYTLFRMLTDCLHIYQHIPVNKLHKMVMPDIYYHLLPVKF